MLFSSNFILGLKLTGLSQLFDFIFASIFLIAEDLFRSVLWMSIFAEFRYSAGSLFENSMLIISYRCKQSLSMPPIITS